VLFLSGDLLERSFLKPFGVKQKDLSHERLLQKAATARGGCSGGPRNLPGNQPIPEKRERASPSLAAFSPRGRRESLKEGHFFSKAFPPKASRSLRGEALRNQKLPFSFKREVFRGGVPFPKKARKGLQTTTGPSNISQEKNTLKGEKPPTRINQRRGSHPTIKVPCYIPLGGMGERSLSLLGKILSPTGKKNLLKIFLKDFHPQGADKRVKCSSSTKKNQGQQNYSFSIFLKEFLPIKSS